MGFACLGVLSMVLTPASRLFLIPVFFSSSSFMIKDDIHEGKYIAYVSDLTNNCNTEKHVASPTGREINDRCRN